MARLARIALLAAGMWGVLAAQSYRVPYSENFDSVAAPSLPAGWIASNCATSTSASHSDPNNVALAGNTEAKTLSSPLLDFSGKVAEALTFYERRSSTAFSYRLQIRAAIDDTVFSILIAEFGPGSTSSSSYAKRSVDLKGKGLDGHASVRIRWFLVADTLDGNTTGVIHLDDVSVTATSAYDLAADRLEILPQFPSSPDLLTCRVTVSNRGVLPVHDYAIRFFITPEGSSSQDFALVAGTPLQPGDSTILSVEHPPVPVGEYIFLAHVEFQGDGNGANDTTSFHVKVSPARGSVLINEIMYAPLGDEPEWVELVNVSPSMLDLKQWRISDSNTNRQTPVTDESVLLAPNEFCIVVKDADFFSVHPEVHVPVLIASFSALNNASPDAVVLYDDRGLVMDSMWYEPSWGGQGGVSLERIDLDQPSTSQSNWSSSLDSSGRTPGRENSIARLSYDLAISALYRTSQMDDNAVVPVLNAVVRNVGKETASGYVVDFYRDENGDGAAESGELIGSLNGTGALPAGDSARASFAYEDPPSGDATIIARVSDPKDRRERNNTASYVLRVSYAAKELVINEIMYDPLPGRSEWVELFDRGSEPVDLAGWRLADAPTAGGSVNSFMIAAGELQPGDYAVIAADSSIFKEYPGLTAQLIVENRSSGLGLSNDGDAIVLSDQTGRVIDSVSYSPSWHQPGIPDAAGRSLERVNPNLDSNDPLNWATSASPSGGTPGAQNSLFALEKPSSASLSISPNPFSPEGDGFEDVTLIHYSLPASTAIIRVRIFDLKGRLVRTLADGEAAGSSGDVVWNGFDAWGRRCRIGPYVVLLEALDGRGGDVASAKAVVVVATRL